MYYNHPCIAILSGSSFMLSSVAFVMCLLVDYKAFQRYINKEDRELVRLRWEILVLTPTEDIIHGILGIYLFYYHIKDFYTFLCIAFSGGMIAARIFKLVIANQGGMHHIKRSTSSFAIELYSQWSTPDLNAGGDITESEESTENESDMVDPNDKLESTKPPSHDSDVDTESSAENYCSGGANVEDAQNMNLSADW